MNEHDSERMTHLLRISGFEAASSLREADVVIVNTCCVREKAEQKFYSLMGRLKGLKRKRGILIGVAGCIAQMEKASIKERLPYIDFALGTSMIWKIRDIIEQAVEKGGTCLEFSEDGLANYPVLEPQARNGSVKAYVTIMQGCVITFAATASSLMLGVGRRAGTARQFLWKSGHLQKMG